MARFTTPNSITAALAATSWNKKYKSSGSGVTAYPALISKPNQKELWGVRCYTTGGTSTGGFRWMTETEGALHAKQNPRKRAKKLTTARGRVTKKPARKTAKSRKTKRASDWLICAHVNGTQQRYYYTGSKFDTRRVEAAKFRSLDLARSQAKALMPKLPTKISSLEIKRLKDAH